MGAGLVGWALATHAGVSDRARLVLVRMALQAVDRHTEPWYGGGWEPLAMALELDGDTGKTAVRRAIRELRDAKLVELEIAAAPGQRARYRLNIRPWNTAPKP